MLATLYMVQTSTLDSTISELKQLGGYIFKVFTTGTYFIVLFYTLVEMVNHIKDRDFQGAFKALLAGAGSFLAIKLSKKAFDIVDDLF